MQDVYNGLEKGLRANGATVGRYNLSDRLNFFSGAHIKKGRRWVPAFSEEAAVTMAAEGIETICYEWWPDVVIVVMGAFIPPRTWAVLARRPHHVVLWATESPYEDDRQSRTARYADTVILNDPTNLEQFKAEITDRTYYFPHSYDPEVHYPGPSEPDLACDFAFVGTGFPSRVEFLESVNWSVHLHPQRTSPGMWESVHTFAEAGRYQMWSDIKHRGTVYSFAHPRFAVGGESRARPRGPIPQLEDRKGGYVVSLQPAKPELLAGQTNLFDVIVRDESGNQVGTDFFLGALMHFVVVKSDLSVYRHAHAREHWKSGRAVTFEQVFPQPGLYKIFAQFRPQKANLPPDEAILAEFWVQVFAG